MSLLKEKILIALAVAVFMPVMSARSAPGCVNIPGRTCWWTADNSARDLMGFADGQLRGGATYAPGRVRQAFSLDGVDDWVEVMHHRVLDARGDDNYYGIAADPPASFTWEAWFQTTNASGIQRILWKYDCGNFCASGLDNYIYGLSLIDGKPQALIRDAYANGPPNQEYGQLLAVERNLADGQFHHLAMVRDMVSTQMLFYVDGLLATNAPLTAGSRGPLYEDDPEHDPLTIGAQIWPNTGALTNFFMGLIDEVAFYHRALLPAEIQAIYDAAELGECQPARIYLGTLGRGGITVAEGATNHLVGDSVTLVVTNGRYAQFQAWSDGDTNNPRRVVLGLTNTFRAILTNRIAVEDRVVQLWDRTYGGTNEDQCFSAAPWHGGVLMGGNTRSGPGGNKTAPFFGPPGDLDCWVVGTDANGNVLFDEEYGGTGSETATVVRPVTEAGWVVAGTAASVAGGNRSASGWGGLDYWLGFRSLPGGRNSDVALGSSGSDRLSSLEETFDQGWIMAGYTTAGVSGIKTTPALGGNDAWVVRSGLFASEIVWQRSLGTTNDEFAMCVKQTRAGNFVVGGYRAGPPIRLTWLGLLDSLGNTIWERTYPFASSQLRVVLESADGGFLLGGTATTSSNLGDFFVLKTDANGNELWHTTVGGAIWRLGGSDNLYTLVETPDGRILAGGSSDSLTGGAKSAPNYSAENGAEDGWLVCFDHLGHPLWDVSFGGIESEQIWAIVPYPGGVYLAGSTYSAPGGSRQAPTFGNSDYWLAKVSIEPVPLGTPVVRAQGFIPPTGSLLVTNAKVVIDITTSFSNQVIRYTLDGSDPAHGEFYSGQFVVDRSVIVRAMAFSPDLALTPEAAPVQIVILAGPVINVQPAHRTNSVVSKTSFSVDAAGAPPLTYQWLHDGSLLPNATNATLEFAVTALEDAGAYRVVVANDFGTVTSAVANLSLVFAPELLTQPASVTTNADATVTFCVTDAGTPPIRYQWRRNGANIPGATNACYSITNVQPSDGGSYSVVLANDVSAVTSDSALLTILVALFSGNDSFEKEEFLLTSPVRASNVGASIESNEPQHAGKSGGHSIWYAWTAPNNGVATFFTSGSTFDTLLAVYTGASVNALTLIAANEDDGGFYNSRLQFNAVSNVTYRVVVDGFAGAQGEFVLQWDFQANAPPLPQIVAQPLSATVTRGQSNVFSVLATPVNVTFQWYFNGTELTNQTNATLTLPSIQPEHVSFYTVRVRSSAGVTVESQRAALEIGPVRQVQSQDKLEDALAAGGGSGGGGNGGGAFHPASAPTAGVLPLLLGSSVTQNINNTGSDVQQGEFNHCGLTGNATRWLVVSNAQDGLLLVDTDGSRIPTVLALYTNTGRLNPLVAMAACGTNQSYGTNNTLARLEVKTGRRYLIVADGVTNATGLIYLNIALSERPGWAQEPSSILARAGSTVTFNALATNPVAAGLTSSLAPPTYQWFLGERLLPGATNASLTLPSVSFSQAGAYTVLSSNRCGTRVSRVAWLEVATVSLLTPFVAAGGTATLNALASEVSGPCTYQWLRFDQPVTGRTNRTLTLASASALDAGEYAVRISGRTATNVLMAGVMSVGRPIELSSLPSLLTFAPGALVTLTVTSVWENCTPTYQWFRDDSALVGANLPSLSFTASRSASYTLNASNCFGVARASVRVLVARDVGLAGSIGTNGTLTLRWQAEAGRRYRIEFTTDLAQPKWELWRELAQPLSVTQWMTISDPVPPSSQRFYRILEDP